jgi:hypothetical protein
VRSCKHGLLLYGPGRTAMSIVHCTPDAVSA